MKIINLSDSHLTEITSDEAATVNGGSGYSLASYSKLYDGYFDFSTTFSDFGKKAPKTYPTIKDYSSFKDYYKSDATAVDSYSSFSVSSSKDKALYP